VLLETKEPRKRAERRKTLYTSRIIKAGALLPDTKTLFAHWEEAATVAQNLARLRRENVFGKASRSRIEDILVIFRQRYLEEAGVVGALVPLCKAHVPAPVLNWIFYFHACRSDRLLHDVVTQVIYELHLDGRKDIYSTDLRSALSQWVAEGKTAGKWSSYTLERVAQGLLSTLRDFGLLIGAVRKHLAPVFLPVEAFSYIAFYLRERQPSGDKLLKDEEWKLFLLSVQQVERLFLEAHQAGLLEYHAAGSVIRIDFPARSLEEYAGVIAQRAH
jgi:hypothetical protein